MDREILRKHLEEAEAHVAEGARHIAEQQARIAKLASLGSNTELAKQLLNSFCATQMQHIQNRERIRAELEHSEKSEMLRRSHQRIELSYKLMAQ